MAGGRAAVVPNLAAACKYINVKSDYYDPIKDKVAAYWYGDLDTILDDDQK